MNNYPPKDQVDVAYMKNEHFFLRVHDGAGGFKHRAMTYNDFIEHGHLVQKLLGDIKADAAAAANTWAGKHNGFRHFVIVFQDDNSVTMFNSPVSAGVMQKPSNNLTPGFFLEKSISQTPMNKNEVLQCAAEGMDIVYTPEPVSVDGCWKRDDATGDYSLMMEPPSYPAPNGKLIIKSLGSVCKPQGGCVIHTREEILLFGIWLPKGFTAQSFIVQRDVVIDGKAEQFLSVDNLDRKDFGVLSVILSNIRFEFGKSRRDTPSISPAPEFNKLERLVREQVQEANAQMPTAIPREKINTSIEAEAKRAEETSKWVFGGVAPLGHSPMEMTLIDLLNSMNQKVAVKSPTSEEIEEAAKALTKRGLSHEDFTVRPSHVGLGYFEPVKKEIKVSARISEALEDLRKIVLAELKSLLPDVVEIANLNHVQLPILFSILPTGMFLYEKDFFIKLKRALVSTSRDTVVVYPQWMIDKLSEIKE